MLEFKLENREKGIFAAYGGGEILGRAFFKTEGSVCDIYKAETYSDEPYVFEGLLRSVYNFAAYNDGAYIGRLSDRDSFPLADCLNFVFDGKKYENDIPSLLTGSCGSCK